MLQTVFPDLRQLKPVGCKRDKQLRLAFGRFRKKSALLDGKTITNEYRAADRWIACDCLGSVPRPPLIYPHRKNGIQREPAGRGPEHDEYCDFAKYPEQQAEVVNSYKRSEPTTRPRRLAPSFLGRRPNDSRELTTSTIARSRPGLAKLLIELLEAANTSTLETGALDDSPDRLTRQIEDIKVAAERVWLDRNQPLSNWLATSFTEYLDLRSRLDDENRDWFFGRPHGLYIDTFVRIEQTTLYQREKGNKPFIEVDGRLYVYGGYEAVRVPYLALCFVAKPNPDAKPRVMRAYAHPCLNATNWALMDSAIEKDTLGEILGLKRYLQPRNIELTILKPISDVGPAFVTERPVCIPDFVVTATGPDRLVPTAVVETIGIKSPIYDRRKEQMKVWHEQVFATAEHPTTPIVRHERAGLTTDNDIANSDNDFWQRLRQTFSSARGRTER
ncbi:MULTISPECIES: hypothetical protein [Rhizobium]|uniref:hypothetical protein n=1 Tax=Rhizobium TaxID=379 RepID=UPI001031ACF1|nr:MULTISPECIES: hypothetical protein [Rhizobium]TBD43454.1 hypothetical protein ELH19_15100 [Rhizobium ruizarguesonis]TBY60625.1 hypothetical protein E0H39_23650 [Rhizobium leguminosarum bv. viciae]